MTDNCRNEHPRSGGGGGGGFGANNNRFSELSGNRFGSGANASATAPSTKSGESKQSNPTKNNSSKRGSESRQGDQITIYQAPTKKPGTFKKNGPAPVETPGLSSTNNGLEPQHAPRSRARDWPRDPMVGIRWELTVVLYEAAQKSTEWTLDTSTIRKDLGDERPRWILSSYGAAKFTPASLFEGNEYSPEEVRWRFYELASKGQEAQADQEASHLWSKADQDIKDALSRINDVQKYMEDADKKHPNRYDYTKMDGTRSKEEFTKSIETTQQAVQSSGFGAGSGFGQPPASTNPFSKPAAASFGQATGPSAFGSSPFGKAASNSAFGQPAFGQSAAGPSTSGSAFGQSATSSAFGQPAAASAFGKPAFGQGFSNASPFAQKAQTPAFGGPAFGQPTQSASPFGQASQPAPAFGQPSQPSSAFGQPNQPGFGQSPFGQPARSGSGFGQSSFGQPAFGQSQEPGKSSPFGQAKSPFGAGTASAGGFGQPLSSSPFGAGTTNAGGFGQDAQRNASPFGTQPVASTAPEISMDSEQPSGFSQQHTNDNSFSTLNAPNASTGAQSSLFGANIASASNNTPSDLPHTLTDRQATPLHYSQTVPAMTRQNIQHVGDDQVSCYRRPDGKGLEKVWFPDAGTTQEVAALNREDKIGDVQAPRAEYTENVIEAYKNLAMTGKFEAGKMPTVPPLREWTSYDF